MHHSTNISVKDTETLCNLVIKHRKKSVTLLGDFNAPSINWKDDLPIALNHPDKIILDMSEFCGLTQLIMQPTRGNNFLDLVLTNSPELFASVTLHPPLGRSDHNMVKCVKTIHPKIVKLIPKHNFSRTDYTAFSNALANIDWHAFFAGCITIDEYWNKFHFMLSELISELVLKYRPKKTLK